MQLNGLTMPEMLVTLAVSLILAFMAAPTMSRQINQFAQSGQVNSLLADLRYARIEAIKRGVSVTLCPSENPLSPSPTCTGAGQWSGGWIVFLDPDRNSTRTDEPVLRRQESFATSSSGIGGINGSSVRALRYNSDGRISGGSNGLVFQSSAGIEASIICINMVGRARVAERGASNCSS